MFGDWKISKTNFLVFLTLMIFISCYQLMASDFPFENLNELSSQLHFSQMLQQTPKQRVKVAIFDSGFVGYEKEIGKTLPSDTVFHAGKIPDNNSPEKHGLGMAQIVMGLMTAEGASPQWAPELHLFNTKGFSNLEAAIDDAIALKIDVVLYAYVWEFGNNFDGGGFINQLISKAAKAGIIMVNAAGNFGQTTFNSKVEVDSNQMVQLPDDYNSLEFECRSQNASEDEKCPARIVLSWNAFTMDPTSGTNQNLDLFLYRKNQDLLELVSSSEAIQVEGEVSRPGESIIAREIIQENLAPGIYYIRIKKMSDNFTADSRLRVVVAGPTVSMKSFDAHESILNPADNADVISVGALDSERTSVSVKLHKPDLFAPSLLKIKQDNPFGVSGEVFARDTSTAAAVVTAGIGVMKSLRPELTRSEIMSFISQTNSNLNSYSQNTNGNRNRAPIIEASLADLPTSFHSWVMPYLERGAKLIRTREGVKLVSPLDPFTELQNYLRSVRAPIPRNPSGNDVRYLISPLGMHTRDRALARPEGEAGVFILRIEEGQHRGRRIPAIELIQAPLEFFRPSNLPREIQNPQQIFSGRPNIPVEKIFMLRGF